MSEITNINTQTNILRNSQRNMGSSELDGDAFLQLLVAQLRNQDPVNPMESAEFAAQLAQFNQVEQLIDLNAGIEDLGFQNELIGTGISNTLAASITGKNVRVQTDIVGFEQGENTKIGFNLGSQTTDVQLTIRDQNGAVIRTETFNNLPSGQHAFEWDGTSNSGVTLPDGAYQVEIQALNGDDPVNAFTFTEGIATRIRYTENGVQLQVNGLFVNLGQVEEIGLAPE